MNMNAFIDQVLKAAKDAGMSQAEVYYASGDDFEADCIKGEIANYSVSTSAGLSLRGLYQGKMGRASTEAFDDQAVEQLVHGVIQSAELIEDTAVQEIFPGSEAYETVDNYSEALDNVDEKRKLDLALALEKTGIAIDARVPQAEAAIVQTAGMTHTLKNTLGLSLTHRDNLAVAYLGMVGKDGDKVSSEGKIVITRDFDALDAEAIAHEAVDKTLFMLNAAPVSSGTYRAIFAPDVMVSFLSTFSGVFSAENAQQGMSLLAGKEGQTVAAPCVTLTDDPLRAGGWASCPFDGEGVACFKKNVLENGVLKTLLHNLKTAKKAGVRTTGNASRAGYAAPVGVAPTNFYFVPGALSPDALNAQMGNGLVILDVSGLHAGANPISGDFSLIAKGYVVKDGKKASAVNQITVAGNFYQLLQNIRAFADDLTFPSGGIGSPSADVGEISVAGK